jgi:hypothetical protein
MLAAKLDPVRLEGEPDESIGPAPAPGMVTACDKITEGQWLLFGTGIHKVNGRAVLTVSGTVLSRQALR